MAKFKVSFVVSSDALGSVLATLDKIGVYEPECAILVGPEDKPKAAAKTKAIVPPVAPPQAKAPTKRPYRKSKRWFKRRYHFAVGGQRKVLLEALKDGGDMTWAEMDKISLKAGYANHGVSPMLTRLTRAGELRKTGWGQYAITEKGAKSVAKLEAATPPNGD